MIVISQRTKKQIEESLNEKEVGKAKGKFECLKLFFSEDEINNFSPSLLKGVIKANFNINENVFNKNFGKWCSRNRKSIKSNKINSDVNVKEKDSIYKIVDGIKILDTPSSINHSHIKRLTEDGVEWIL